MKKVKKLLAMMTAIVLIGTEFCGAGRNVYAAEPVNDMAISDTVGIADVTDAITDDLITDTVTGVEDMFNEDAADTVFAEEPEEETGPEGDLVAPEEDVVSQGEGLDTYNEEDADTEEAPDEDYIDDGLQPDGAVTFEKTVANTMFGTAGMASPRAPLYDNDGWQGSYVYYGKYAGKPVKYRVLDKQTTDFNKPENTSPTMFLDCNGCVYDHRYDDANHFSNWKNSELRSGLNGSLFLNGNVFTEMEKEAITESYKSKKNSKDGIELESEPFQKLEGEKVFLLDRAEITNTSYGYPKHTDKTQTRNKRNDNSHYWLRNYTDIVERDGSCHISGNCSWTEGISPAFNIDLSRILFSSAVKGDVGESATEYKITLATDKFTGNVSTEGNVKAVDNIISIPYNVSGAYGDLANAVSVLILDGEYKGSAGNNNKANILYYGKLDTGATFSKTGTGTFTMPSSLDINKWGSDYKVYLFAEQMNGTQQTDYASRPQEILKSKIKVTENVTVTFNANGHGTDPDAQRIEKGTKAKKPADPTANGWLFRGWYKNAECTGTAFNFNENVNSNTSLYAKWVKENLTVTFNMNGGGSPQPSAQTVRNGNSAVKPTDPARDGYVFGGWHKQASCTASSKYDFSAPVENDITLYAKWRKICTITFDAGGGTGTMAPVTVTQEDYYKYPENEFESPSVEKAFNGWSYQGGVQKPGYMKQVNDDMTLMASWRQLDYKTVTFSSMGTDFETVRVKNGDKVSKPTSDPARENYTFLGWYTRFYEDNKADNEYLFDFNKTVITKDTKLYACWMDNTKYTVKTHEDYYNKGGRITANKSSAGVNESVTVTITPEPGFDLVKLADIPYLSGEHSVGKKEALVSDSESGIIKTGDTYTYTFQVPDLKYIYQAANRYVDIAAHFTATHEHVWVHHHSIEHTCTEEGFRGYAECKVCGHKYNYSDEEEKTVNTATGEITGEPEEWRKIYAYHELEEFPAKAATCKDTGNLHYWHCTKCGIYCLNSNMPDETECTLEDTVVPIDPNAHVWDDATITYIWSEDNKEVTGSYTCTIDPSHKVRETVTTTETFTKEPTCTTEGAVMYTTQAFKDPAFTTQTKTGIPVEKLGHDWGEPEYKWADDYSSCTATMTCKRDETHKETETVTSKGWDTPDGKTYTAEFTKELFEDQAIDVVEVIFDMNGQTASDVPEAQKVGRGMTPDKPAKDPKAEGFKFGGWYADSEGKRPFDFNAPITKDTIVYARWIDKDKETFTVTFNANGHGAAPASQIVEKDASAADPGRLKADGYMFTGWYTDAECKNKYSFSTPVTANITLYAGWVEGTPVIISDGDAWNLYEDISEHDFDISGIYASGTKENINAKSKNFYDATLAGSTISVKVTGDRKKAATAANTTLEFDLGEDGIVEYILPVCYVKPAFKLSSASAAIKDGASTTVRTRLLYKAPGGNFEPYDMTGVKVSGLDGITVAADGAIEITGSKKQSGNITVIKDGWDSFNPVKVKYSVKTSTKDVLDVDLQGLKTVTLNTNATDQSFEYAVTLNGVAGTKDTVQIEDKKSCGLAEMTDTGKLKIAYKDGTAAGNYTVTLKAGTAKVSVKIKVSSKPLDGAVTGKIQSKLDVVSGQEMVVIPTLKEVGGKITGASVTSPADFTARVNEAGNIVIGYTGDKYDIKNLKIGEMKIALTISGISTPVALTLKGVSAQKTTPTVKAAQVNIPANVAPADDKVIGTANILSTYKTKSGMIRRINPVKVVIDTAKCKNVTASVNTADITEIDIIRLSAKSGSVPVAVTYPGGIVKTLTIKIKAK